MQLARSPIIILLSALILSGAGCDRGLEQELQEEVELHPKWNWDNYPRARELQLGTKRVNIQPKRSLEISGNSTGRLNLIIDKEIAQVPKDYLFAEMDKDKLEDERVKLDIARRKEDFAEINRIEFEDPQRMKDARERLETARKHLARIDAIMNSKTLKKEAGALFGSEYEKVGAKEKLKAEEELSLAEKQFILTEKYDPIRGDDQQTLSVIVREESEQSYEDKKELGEYRVPFSGELRILLDDYVTGESDYQVATRELIATLSDFSEMDVSLPILGESWVSLDPSTLYLKLEDSHKTLVEYSEEKIERNSITKKEEKNYIFSIVTAEQPDLKRLSGTSMEANLITRLPKRCWIIPKVDVAMEALGKSKSKVWADIVDDVWNGAVVVAEGENSLAIDYSVIKIPEIEPALDPEVEVSPNGK